MKKEVLAVYQELLKRYPDLEGIKEHILSAYEILAECYRNGGKVMTCGNGGSCSDSEHIVGELMKSFTFKRKIREDVFNNLEAAGEMGVELTKYLEGALPAISLCGHPALTTAYLNDTNPQMTFAQQVYGFGEKGDVLITISTSGNSKNCLYAAQTARAMGIKVITLTGITGGKLMDLSDVTICAPSCTTFKIQEYHLPIYHALCAMLENEFFEYFPR